MLNRLLEAFLTGLGRKSLLVALLAGAILTIAGWQHGYTNEQLRGEVVAVADGDTLTVLDDRRRQLRVRMAFIDAPERAQPFGLAARKALAARVFRQQVRLDVIEQDKYGRLVARVWLQQEDINLQQLRDGNAWHYRYFARDKQSRGDFAIYAAAEQQARDGRLGLWRLPTPVPPWQFRQHHQQSGGSVETVSGNQPDRHR